MRQSGCNRRLVFPVGISPTVIPWVDWCPGPPTPWKDPRDATQTFADTLWKKGPDKPFRRGVTSRLIGPRHFTGYIPHRRRGRSSCSVRAGSPGPWPNLHDL